MACCSPPPTASRRAATWLLLALLALLGLPRRAEAEPVFSAWTGQRCGACHVNATGAGMLTDAGAAFVQDDLATFPSPAPFDPWITPYTRIGAVFRLAEEVVLPAQTELAGAEYAVEGEAVLRIADASLRLRIDPIRDVLSLVVDETFSAEGADTREAYAMMRAPFGGWVKAGRFQLPYGLRLDDDRAFVREQPDFTSERRDIGVEVGLDRDPVSFALAFASPNPVGLTSDEAKRLAGTVTVTASPILGGVSVAWDHTSTQHYPAERLSVGGHLGARVGPVSALAEADWVHGFDPSGGYDQWMLYTDVEVLAYRGLYLRAGWEVLDPVLAEAHNNRDRFRFGATWFPVPLVALRADYHLNRDIPQRPEGNADEVRVEIHGFM